MGTVPRQANRRGWRPAALRLAAVCAFAGLLATLYWFGVRPRQLHWGARPEDLRMHLPEDGIVSHPAFDATRAITIAATPHTIWPWLVQMGYGRAGFYGYDLIENPGGGRGLCSATAILPQFQHPQTGDVLPLSVAASLRFGTIDPNRTLVWRSGDDPPTGVYIWALVPVDAGHTRLISRIRWRYVDGVQGRVLGVFTEFADHVAVRAILRGVRDRAEGRRPPSLVLQGFEIAGWLLVLLEMAAALAMVLRGRHAVAWWCIALGSGLMLLLVFYGGASAWINVAAPWIWLAAIVLAIRWLCREPRASRTRPLGAG
jgi:hypothetical protein